MALSEEEKRRAVSAVRAVRDDIHRVITTGTTGYDAFGQPNFPADEAPEVPWVEKWRETQDRNALIEEAQAKQRGMESPDM